MQSKTKVRRKIISSLMIFVFMLSLMINFPLKAYAGAGTPPAPNPVFSGIPLGTGFNTPIDVIFDKYGNLYVSDYQGNKIVKMDANGDNITNIATNIDEPIGMAFDNLGNLYVALHQAGKILKIDQANNITDLRTGMGVLTGLVIDSTGHIFTADYGAGKIYKMDADGDNLTEFAAGFSSGTAIGLSIDKSDNLYLSLTNSNRIKKIDPSGYVTDFGSGFGAPYWVTVGNDGYIYVSDAVNLSIKRFDISGNFDASFNTGMNMPWGTAINVGGYIYFANMNGKVIKLVGDASTIDPTHIMLKMNDLLIGTNLDYEAFSIQGAASKPIVTSADIQDGNVILTLSAPIAYGENNVKIGYNKPTLNCMVNIREVELESFIDLPLRNLIPAVAAVTAIPNITVANGTTQSAIGLPQKVNVTLSTGITTSAAITWDNGSPAYNGNTAGTYAFSGTLTLPDGVVNPENKSAKANVIVSSPIVTSVNSLSNINVAYGTTASAIGLPNNVIASLNNGTTTTSAIVWNNGDPTYNWNNAGVYVFTGTLAVPNGVINPSNIKGQVNVIVGTAPVTTAAVISVPSISDISVINGTPLGSINLPNTITVALNNASTTRAAITWDNGSPLYNGSTAGTYVFKGILTLPQGVYNPGNIKASVNVIVGPQTVVNTPVSSGGGGGGGSSSTDTSVTNGNTRIVEVVAGSGKESGIAPVTVEIVRTVENGVKIDTVKLDESKTMETIIKAIENKKDLATILITDLKDNKADKVEVQISKDSTDKLSKNNIGLKIDSEKVKLELPKDTLKALLKDIKLDIQEVRDSAKVDRTKATADSLVKGAEVFGNPIEISTNYSEKTQVTIPLDNINLPKDEQALKKMLASLAVLIEHSDGENLIDKGEIKYDDRGNAIGIAVWVKKFSTFTVVGLPVKDIDDKAAEGTPEIKFVGLGHSPLVEGDKEEFTISSGFNGNVQYRIYLNVDGAWKEVTNGYSAPVSGKETFSLTPDYKFEKGLYQGRVYVKKAGVQGSRMENGIDFDNYYTYNINVVDRDDANRVYTTGNLNINKDAVKVGEKITITGIDGINGIEGPYFYRLHIYDVANDKWTNNVMPYSPSLEWTPNAAGTYVLDVHVITPNSALWDNVQKDPSVIYGGYEGWKLKTIKVSDGQSK